VEERDATMGATIVRAKRPDDELGGPRDFRKNESEDCQAFTSIGR
jgi:hypothetical protein